MSPRPPAHCYGSAASDKLHAELHHAYALRPDGDRVGARQGGDGVQNGEENGQWDTENIWETAEVSMYMTNGVIVHDTSSPVAQEQRTVLRARRQNGKDGVEERAAAGTNAAICVRATPVRR